MNEEALRELLKLPEGPTLEFKQEIKIYLADEAGKREKDELRKDLLALANGNSTVASENKYLIFGASDKFTPGTSRETFDIGNKYPTRRDLLNMLKAVSNPFLDRLEADIVTVDGNRLLVITIPPTRYLLETTRRLKASKRDFDEYTVFFRQDEEAIPASASVRDAIRLAKEKYFNERHDVPPVEYGLAVGAIISGVDRAYKENRVGSPVLKQVIAAILGMISGGFKGWVVGYSYKETRSLWGEIQEMPVQWRVASITFLTIFWTILALVFRQYARMVNRFFARYRKAKG